jgi:hypothetical protein
MQEEIYKRLHAPKLGPCVCSQVRRLARKPNVKFLSQIGTESLQELRALLASSESAVTKAFTTDQEKP